MALLFALIIHKLDKQCLVYCLLDLFVIVDLYILVVPSPTYLTLLNKINHLWYKVNKFLSIHVDCSLTL
jgi:hypothetical protein